MQDLSTSTDASRILIQIEVVNQEFTSTVTVTLDHLPRHDRLEQIVGLKLQGPLSVPLFRDASDLIED